MCHRADRCVVSQFETVATQSPPIHRAGGAGGALGTRSGCLAHRPPVGCRYACPDVLRRVSKAPPTPPALAAVLKVGSRTRGARLSCAAGRDGVPPTFLRHAGLRSAVIVGIPRESFAARLRGPSAAGRAGETGGPSETRRSTS